VGVVDWSQCGRVLVLIDAANIGKGAQHSGFKVRYRQLARLFREQSQLVDIRFYTADFETDAHQGFLRSLQHFGYRVVSKPVKVISTGKSQVIRKANFDVEMAVDAMEILSCYDTLVLFSGDSDFAYLVRHLQSKGKRVVVCSMRGNVARELIKSTDQYVDLYELGADVVRKMP